MLGAKLGLCFTDLQSSAGAIEQPEENKLGALAGAEGSKLLPGPVQVPAPAPAAGPTDNEAGGEAYALPQPASGAPPRHASTSSWLPELTNVDMAALGPDPGLTGLLPASLCDSSTCTAAQHDLPADPFAPRLAPPSQNEVGASPAPELQPCTLDQLLPAIPLFGPANQAPLHFPGTSPAISAASAAVPVQHPHAPGEVPATWGMPFAMAGAYPVPLQGMLGTGLGSPHVPEGMATSGDPSGDSPPGEAWDMGPDLGDKRPAEGLPDDSFDGEEGFEGVGEGARASKRPRLVWTPELHTRFLNAVNHLVMSPFTISLEATPCVVG